MKQNIGRNDIVSAKKFICPSRQKVLDGKIFSFLKNFMFFETVFNERIKKVFIGRYC
jgi:hypothetical protein